MRSLFSVTLLLLLAMTLTAEASKRAKHHKGVVVLHVLSPHRESQVSLLLLLLKKSAFPGMPVTTAGMHSSKALKVNEHEKQVFPVGKHPKKALTSFHL